MLSMCTASKYLVINSLVRPSASPFFESSFEDFVPAVGLQDRDIIIFLELADFVGDLHTLSEQLQQFIIKVIDLLP